MLHVELFDTRASNHAASSCRGKYSLKPRNIRERQLAPMHMHPAELRAAMEHGKHFSRIEQLLLVERGLDCNLLGEIDVVEHFWHQIAFFDADAMFARQHAADRNA